MNLADYTDSMKHTSMMSHQRIRTQMTKPQPHDISHIQVYWGN